MKISFYYEQQTVLVEWSMAYIDLAADGLKIFGDDSDSNKFLGVYVYIMPYAVPAIKIKLAYGATATLIKNDFPLLYESILNTAREIFKKQAVQIFMDMFDHEFKIRAKEILRIKK